MPAPLPHDAFARAVRAAFGADARVVGEEPLAGDASTRRYVRLRLEGGRSPSTAVVMLLPPDANASPEVGGSGSGVRELPFINVGRYFGASGLPVPAVHHDASAGADALLLLEDIGDTTLFAAAQASPADAGPLFERAVDLLVELQTLGARAPDPRCYAFGRRFDVALAYGELEHFVEHGIETRQGRALPAAERARLLAALEPVCEPFATTEPVLSHRDYMAWNLHVQQGSLRMIDFQDALLAPDAFDLSQLLTDRTTITVVPPPLEEALVARFLAGRAAKGLPLAGDFVRRYRLCALQHALKVIGRFHFLDRVRGKPGYLAYLPSVYVVARRMLAMLPEVADAVPLVAAHVPELAPEGT
jgi:aminoglycoside/choline kinase family phosphotransferase